MHFKKVETVCGASLYVCEMPWVEGAIVAASVVVGTRDENWPAEAGLAHATEHMVFRGTEDFPEPGSLDASIENLGGITNAFTSKELTCFFVRLQAGEVQHGVHFLHQILRKPLLRQSDIDIEIKNIIQELNRAKDDHQCYLLDRFEEILYGRHPLFKSILGKTEALERFTTSNFRLFLQRFYQADRIKFLAVGKITAERAQILFNLYFNESNEGASLIKEQRTLISQIDQGIKRAAISRDIKQAHIVMGAPTTAVSVQAFLPLSIFVQMIDFGMSSPLFQEVRAKRGLAYEIWATQSPRSDLSHFKIYVGTEPSRIKEAIEVCQEVMAANKGNGDLLQRTKKQIIGNRALEYDDPANIFKSAVQELNLRNRILSFEEWRRRVEAITIEEVEAAVDAYLAPEKLTTVILGPKKMCKDLGWLIVE